MTLAKSHSKVCRTCGESKSLTDYYTHKQMSDGHLNICKSCVKDRVNNHREENLGRIQEYDRKRGLLEHRRENVRRSYKKRKEDPVKWEKELEYKRRYVKSEKFRQKRKCHEIVNNAIRDGRLFVGPCQKCYNTHDIDAHHEDYTKPLAITWLCKKCHGERHRELNELKRKCQ